MTSGVLKEDPYHTECLPVHVSCLVQTNNSNGKIHEAWGLNLPGWGKLLLKVTKFRYESYCTPVTKAVPDIKIMCRRLRHRHIVE